MLKEHYRSVLTVIPITKVKRFVIEFAMFLCEKEFHIEIYALGITEGDCSA